MDKPMLEFYTDYLLSSFSRATATNASSLSHNSLSHDSITRFLSEQKLSSRSLWYRVKPLVRSTQSDDGIIIVDDTISHKPHMDESDIVCWYYDHTEDRIVKGINIISVLYHSNETTLPVPQGGIVSKDSFVQDKKTGQPKRVSTVSKNTHFCDLLRSCSKNIPFRYVFSDVWYASAENMKFVKNELHKDFIMPLKSNRKIALSEKEKLRGNYVTVETVRFKNDEPIKIYLEGVTFPVLLVKQVFQNKDGSTGTLYLVSSDTTLTTSGIIDLYQKRWKIEEYHKALKQQCSLTRSPARTVVTQSTHIFCSLCAFIKLETICQITSMSYEGLKLNLYIHSLKTAYAHLRTLMPLSWATKPLFA